MIPAYWPRPDTTPTASYLEDTGLLAHSLGLTVERMKLDGTLAGGVLENFVLMELRKQAAWSETQPEFFYWRTASGQEVDLVLEDRAGRLVGVDVCRQSARAAATASLCGAQMSALRFGAKAPGLPWSAARQSRLHPASRWPTLVSSWNSCSST